MIYPDYTFLTKLLQQSRLNAQNMAEQKWDI